MHEQNPHVMKKNVSPSVAVKGILLAALSIVLFAFAPRPGGDSFQIYVNNKLTVNEHIYGQRETPKLSLNREAGQDQLSVNYSHCGETGTARAILLKDDQNKVLKEWRYADVEKTQKDPMNFTVKDIAAFAGKNNLGLYYSSKELSKDFKLVSISFTKDSTTALNR